MILAKPNHIKIYGHRGARGDLPENTLDSFKEIRKYPNIGIELDVLLTKDNLVVCCHDNNLKRMTNIPYYFGW